MSTRHATRLAERDSAPAVATDDAHAFLSATCTAFVGKLWQIFTTEQNRDICSFAEGGDTVVIKNVPTFTSKILPRYFSHANIQSFVRQLNMVSQHRGHAATRS